MTHRAILMLIAFLPVLGCNSHAYYEEAKVYVSEAQNTLVEAQWCKGKRSCSVNDIVKFEAGGWSLGPLTFGGVSINVYQVDDPAVAAQVISRLRIKHASSPVVSVQVRIFASKHGESKRLTAEEKVG